MKIVQAKEGSLILAVSHCYEMTLVAVTSFVVLSIEVETSHLLKKSIKLGPPSDLNLIIVFFCYDSFST
jgi:hypothetical protein